MASQFGQTGMDRNTPGAAFGEVLNCEATATAYGSAENQVPPISSIRDLELDPTLARNVGRIITSLTPVQRYAMPALIRRVNVLGCSYTGSGKTAAFLVPVLNNIMKLTDVDILNKRGLPAQPVALVVAPTRELAIQIKEEARTYCQDTVLQNSVHLVCGGKDMELERIRLSTAKCNLIIATAGRLDDLIKQDIIDLSRVRYFVLDEADVMMDKGFFYDVLNFSKLCNVRCVSAMFSATYPNAVRKAAESILDSSFLEIQVGQDGTASKTISQDFQLVERGEKNFWLKTVLESRPASDKILVFGSTIEDVDRIHQFLLDENLSAGVLHSGLESQRQREFVLNEFKLNRVHILIATSVASRGLDIPNVNLVLNYDLPVDIEEYILRIGRTGRVGNIGSALSFFEIERDGPLADKLISSLRRVRQPVPGWLTDIKLKIQEDQERIFQANDIGEFSNKKRIFNSIGSSVAGIPCSTEAEDDTWD